MSSSAPSSHRLSRVFGSVRSSRRAASKPRQPPLDFEGLFTEENRKKPSKDEERKIEDIRTKLEGLSHHKVPDARIEYCLRHRSVEGDVNRAIRLLLLYKDSVDGILSQYNPVIKMLGAENRGKITCYLSSTMAAMFSKPTIFEAMLYYNFDDQPRRRLITTLRLWVNMLRSGFLITTDIMKNMQDSLSECGWKEAAKMQQQDASEFFGYLTDFLKLPLLTIKTDLYHAGKEDVKDDHKFITERMLDVAIPDDLPAGQNITLEQCLENYFNNKVEVKRYLKRRNTAASAISTTSIEKPAGALHVEAAEVSSAVNTPVVDAPQPTFPIPIPQRPNQNRERGMSIFSERKVEFTEGTKFTDPTDKNGIDPVTRQRTNSIRKEVSMPAWQFLNLIPWYIDNAADNDNQVSMHFSQKRPMLGICLKRYKVSPTGVSSRLSTHVDVPLELASPHFAGGSELDVEGNSSVEKFKVSLQAVVCHRGISVDSGHYIALLRVDAERNRVDNHEAFAEASAAPQHDASHDPWLCFDDLATERVRQINIHEMLGKESPYLLFYRVEPIEGDESESEHPPPYSESNASLDLIDQKLQYLAENGRESPESSEQPASARVSMEISNSNNEPGSRSSIASNRRASVQKQVDSATASIAAPQTSSDSQTESPVDESKSSGFVIRTRPASTLKVDRAEKRPSDSSEKRLSISGSLSLSRITSKLSKDKIITTNGVLPEQAIDDRPTSKTSKESKGEAGVTVSKGKDKKPSRFKSMSRRGSGGHGGGGAHTGGPTDKVKIEKVRKGRPDRDCIVM